MNGLRELVGTTLIAVAACVGQTAQGAEPIQAKLQNKVEATIAIVKVGGTGKPVQQGDQIILPSISDTGIGVVVLWKDSRGLILTAKHVVREDYEFEVKGPGIFGREVWPSIFRPGDSPWKQEQPIIGGVELERSGIDLALIEFASSNPRPFVSEFNTCPLPQGTEVYIAWWRPRLGRPEIVPAQVATQFEAAPHLVRLQVSQSVFPGDSGSPIFDGAGRMVGTLQGREFDQQQPNLAYMVPISKARGLLPFKLPEPNCEPSLAATHTQPTTLTEPPRPIWTHLSHRAQIVNKSPSPVATFTEPTSSARRSNDIPGYTTHPIAGAPDSERLLEQANINGVWWIHLKFGTTSAYVPRDWITIQDLGSANRAQ